MRKLVSSDSPYEASVGFSRAVRAGATRYLRKPFSNTELTSTIRALLSIDN